MLPLNVLLIPIIINHHHWLIMKTMEILLGLPTLIVFFVAIESMTDHHNILQLTAVVRMMPVSERCI